MSKVLYEKDGRIARITLNRPEVMNAIDDDVPTGLAEAVARAEADRVAVKAAELEQIKDAFRTGDFNAPLPDDFRALLNRILRPAAPPR